MDRRPDIVAAKYQLQAARDFAGEPLLRIVPTLSLQAQATFAGLVALLAVLYVTVARRQYQGPEWSRRESERHPAQV